MRERAPQYIPMEWVREEEREGMRGEGTPAYPGWKGQSRPWTCWRRSDSAARRGGDRCQAGRPAA